jgi:hypothetical protein
MKNRNLATILPLLMAIVSISFGCASAQPGSNNAKPAATETKITKVTKENLKARLAGKNVQFIEKLPDNPKWNPLFLMIKIVGSGADGKNPLKATLNNEAKQGVSELVTQLRSIFKYREDNGVFLEGKNEVDKRLNIAAGDGDVASYNKEGIYVEDFEKLIDELQKAGIDQISIDLTEREREMSIDDLKPPPSSKKAKP